MDRETIIQTANENLLTDGKIDPVYVKAYQLMLICEANVSELSPKFVEITQRAIDKFKPVISGVNKSERLGDRNGQRIEKYRDIYLADQSVFEQIDKFVEVELGNLGYLPQNPKHSVMYELESDLADAKQVFITLMADAIGFPTPNRVDHRKRFLALSIDLIQGLASATKTTLSDIESVH